MSEFRQKAGIPLILAGKLVIWGEIEAVRAMDETIRIDESEVLRVEELIAHPWGKTSFSSALGPGLITGASDDDPSGIGTYSSVGAKFGLAILWMAAWLLPIMLAVQEVSPASALSTNKGLAGFAGTLQEKIVMLAVLLLIIANVVNIGADIGAMAASLKC